MVTNVWLESQPKKKIAYPDCYPYFNVVPGYLEGSFIHIKDSKDRAHATYLISQITRLEYRPK